MSMMWAGVCRISPRAWMPAGQWTISGVVIPPSWTQVLWRRNGVLQALEKPGPRHR